MKILLCEHPQHTSSTWQLYEGLLRVLGWESVVEYPYKPIWHGRKVHDLTQSAWYQRAESDLASGQLPTGIPPFAPGETMLSGDERVVQRNFPWSHAAPPSPQREHDEIELVETIDQYDLVVLGNSNRVPTIALARLSARCGKRMPPIVYVDGGERDEFNAHWAHVFRPQLTFKQILTPEVVAEYQGHFINPRVPVEMFPLPLANPWVNLAGVTLTPTHPRSIDVVSHFGATWPARADLQQQIEKTACAHNLVGVLGQTTETEYFTTLAEARIGVSMRGSGRDTNRYWDIPALGAALLCDGTMGCIHPYPFVDGQTARFYRSLDEAATRLIGLHEQEDYRRKIADAGREHLRKYHSVEARALFFLAIVRQQLGIEPDAEQAKNCAIWRERFGWSSELPEWRGEVV